MPYCNHCGTRLNGDYIYCMPCNKIRQNQLEGMVRLGEKERNYHFGMIKGRMAETLIQELFLSQGYNVYRYGMESTIPGVMKLLTGISNEISEQIKRMPDFVVQHPNSRALFFVEVKFRSNGRFSKKDLPDNYPFFNSHLILVSKNDIQCATVKELMDGLVIEAGGPHHLGNRIDFAIPKSIIEEFCDFSRKMYSGL